MPAHADTLVPVLPPSRKGQSTPQDTLLVTGGGFVRVLVTVKYRFTSLVLSAIHFQGTFIRLVSCYTLLGGFRLAWQPSNCHNENTPFVVSH